jgi:hypothetical protein
MAENTPDTRDKASARAATLTSCLEKDGDVAAALRLYQGPLTDQKRTRHL